MPDLKIKYDTGNDTSSDPSEAGLVQTTGGYYRPGDTRLHKVGGVTEFDDTDTGKKIDGLAVLQYDSGGTDKLVALSDRVLYGANLTNKGASGTFSSLKSGLGTNATSLSAAQFNDKWYLGLVDENLVVGSDGTTRAMMKAPQGSITATPADIALSTVRPSSSTAVLGTMTNASSAYDSDKATYGYSVSYDGAGDIVTFNWDGTSNTGTNRFVRMLWSIGTSGGAENFQDSGSIDDVGTGTDAGYVAGIIFKLSEDAGSTWTVLLSQNFTTQEGINYISFPITDGLEVDGNLRLRATMRNTSVVAAVFAIYDITAGQSVDTATFSTTTGLYYGVTEWDADDGVESSAITSGLVTLSTQNHVRLTLPAAAANSNATHWRIYRTSDGGSSPQALYWIDTVTIATTTYEDAFQIDKDSTGNELYPMLRAVSQQDASASSPLYFHQNAEPPAFAVIRTFEGSLVGLSRTKPRALYYSVAGKPESWPKINVIESFPFETHDELFDCVSLGAVLVLAARGLMMRLTSLPRAVLAIRDGSRVEPIKGAPGCVGRKALTAYSVAGEPAAAWISPYGVYITNGDEVRRISETLDWEDFDGTDKSDWVLEWDAKRLCLMMFYSSSGGTNDRYILFHMAPEHRTSDGQPKWTGPHYGSYNVADTGQVGSTHRVYGGHVSNGSVYTLAQSSVGTDASSPYSGTQLPLIVKTGKAYNDTQEWSALTGRLYHTDFGNGETCTMDWESGNDNEDGDNVTFSQSVSLTGHKGTQFDVSQRCQWAQQTITYTGEGTGALLNTEIEVAARGRSGQKKAS